MRTHILLLILLLFTTNTDIIASGKNKRKAIEKILSPDYVNLQYAGNVGLGSVGFGYLSDDEKKNFGISYGFLPSSVNNAEVHTFSAKGAFNLKKHKLSERTFANAYWGSNILYSATNNTYLKFPGYYPSGYYFTNALHLAPFVGLKVGSRKNTGKFSYVELGTLDYYLINHIKYRRSEFSDCLNICMGIALPLNKNQENVLP